MEARDLAALQRWEVAGGTWRLDGRRVGPDGADVVTITLCRCDGGEEVDRLVSAEPALIAYVVGPAVPAPDPRPFPRVR